MVSFEVKDIIEVINKCRDFRDYEQLSMGLSPSIADISVNSMHYINNNAVRIFNIIKLIDRLIIEKKDGANSLTLLEVGTGYGELIISVSKAFSSFQYFGLEHPSRVFMRQESYLKALRDNNIKLMTSDITKGTLPFEDSSFDMVLCCEVIEHLSPVIVPLLFSELARVTKRDGNIIIASPNLSSLFNRIVMLKGDSVFEPAVPLVNAGGTFGHIRLYNVKEIERLATLHGLLLVDVEYDDNMSINGSEKIHTIITKKVQKLVAKIIPTMANNWTVILRK